MHRVTVSRELNHEAAAVWQLLDDFGAIHTYNPSVESAEVLTPQPTGLGARRVCHFYDGTSVKETITRYDRDRGYSIELSDFSMPLKTATSHFEVRGLGSKRSQVSVAVEFAPKFGLIGWFMARIMMVPMMKRALTALTKGLDDHLRTGLPVGKGGTLSSSPD